MNFSELLSALRNLVHESSKWLGPFLQRRGVMLLSSAMCAFMVIIAWGWYQSVMHTHFTILVGPEGGSTFDSARLMKNQIERQSGKFWRTYSVTLEPTQGYEENRKRISIDHSGNVIGFGHDGFGESRNIRVLLPLEKNYLHVIVRKKWIDEINRPASNISLVDSVAPFLGMLQANRVNPNKGIQLKQLLPYLKPGRVYAGPPDSGTHQMAEIVLDQLGVEVDDFQTHGVDNWNDMRSALRTDWIDVAFYSGPIDAPAVRSIAKDKSAFLVDLGEERDPIDAANHHVLAGTFQPNAYGQGFCPNKVNTIVTRRVLICSSMMDDRTANLLGPPRLTHCGMTSPNSIGARHKRKKQLTSS